MAGQTVNVAPTPPTYVAFYTPAALALLLRHLAVTLIALSLVRDRTLGAVELFRVSPVSPRAILLGKTVAFAALALALAALLVLLFHAVGIVKLHRELRLG